MPSWKTNTHKKKKSSWCHLSPDTPKERKTRRHNSRVTLKAVVLVAGTTNAGSRGHTTLRHISLGKLDLTVDAVCPLLGLLTP